MHQKSCIRQRGIVDIAVSCVMCGVGRSKCLAHLRRNIGERSTKSYAPDLLPTMLKRRALARFSNVKDRCCGPRTHGIGARRPTARPRRVPPSALRRSGRMKRLASCARARRPENPVASARRAPGEKSGDGGRRGHAPAGRRPVAP